MTYWLNLPISRNNDYIVSEWLLFNTNSAIFQLYQIKFQWDDGEVRFALDQHAELDFYSASSRKQQSADGHVALLGHIILIASNRSLSSVFLMMS